MKLAKKVSFENLRLQQRSEFTQDQWMTSELLEDKGTQPHPMEHTNSQLPNLDEHNRQFD